MTKRDWLVPEDEAYAIYTLWAKNNTIMGRSKTPRKHMRRTARKIGIQGEYMRHGSIIWFIGQNAANRVFDETRRMARLSNMILNDDGRIPEMRLARWQVEKLIVWAANRTGFAVIEEDQIMRGKGMVHGNILERIDKGAM